MSKEQIVRAWKDPSFRASLSAAELAVIPANPAGESDLVASELSSSHDAEDAAAMMTFISRQVLCCD